MSLLAKFRVTNSIKLLNNMADSLSTEDKKLKKFGIHAHTLK
jgi:hypothetical protein